MNYKAICLIFSSLLATSVNAQEKMSICGELKQGELVVIKNIDATTNSIVLNEKEYPVTADGYAILAFHRDEKNNQEILTDNGKYKLDIKAAIWDIQRINGVPQQKVTPDKSNDAEIMRERNDVAKSVNNMEPGDYWREGFIMPVKGRISGYFGNQRVFNGTPKSPHNGTDIAAPEGTPIKASGSGKVILNGKNYFYTGNMVIIDHGQGLQTMYAHMKDSNVKVGDIVEKGDIIGTVGKTGRVTGPHLHWGASLNNIRFRPQSLLDINEKKCQVITGENK